MSSLYSNNNNYNNNNNNNNNNQHHDEFSDQNNEINKQELLDKMVEDLDKYMVDENTEDDYDEDEDYEDQDGYDIFNNSKVPLYIVEDNLDFKNYSHIKKSDGSSYSSIEEIINYLIIEKKALDISSSSSSSTIPQSLEQQQHQQSNKSEYSEHLENELKSLPSAVINTYFEQANSLVELHRYIKSNRDILNSIGESFDTSIEELSDLIKDMPDNHVASLQISKSLENRIDAREEIFKLVEKVTIPPDLINNLVSDDVNEEYIKNIKILQDRIKNLDSLMQTKAKFIQDIALEIDLLKKKASRSVREFLIKLIIGLRKPRTNIQILQQSKLFKYSPLNEFIYHNSPSYAIEIKNLYIDTVSKTFLNYFKNYLSNLTKVFLQITSKFDIIGYLEIVKSYFNTPIESLNKVSAFNLYIPGLPNDIWTSIKSELVQQVPDKLSRIDILERCLDAPLIIPHVAIKNSKRYPFEQCFRSMNILLVDTICSEYLFNRQWFSKPLLANSPDALIPSIFDKIFQLYLDNLNSFLTSTFDCLALLLCLQVNKILIQLLKDRNLWDRISVIRQYFQKVDSLIWDRFSEVFKRNIDSLKNAQLSKENYPIDLRPHIYTRRFSEFYSSCCIILSINDEPRVAPWLTVLRTSLEKLLLFYSNQCFNNDKKLKSIFLINNFDIIITVFSENNIQLNEDGFLLYSKLLQEQITLFVDLLLYSYYKNLITFIKDTEFSLSNVSNYQIDRNQLLSLIYEFSQKWKDILQKIQSEIMLNFSNFNLGSTITKQIISQYLLYYKRFEEIFKKYLKQSSSSPDSINQQQQLRSAFIPVSTITYEIGKSYNNNKDLI